MSIQNQIALSDDITQITAEIKSYQQVGGQAIVEIGRRLNWVKDHNLQHGEFGDWLESVGFNWSTANKFMKIGKEFRDSESIPNRGWAALYEIATLPESQRDRPQLTDGGEMKTPDEMSVSEIKQLKKQLKESKQHVETLDLAYTGIFEENQRLKANPKVVEKKVEVAPADYEQMKKQAKNMTETIDYMKKLNANLQAEINEKTDDAAKYQRDSEEYQRIKDQIAELQGKRSKLERKVNAAARVVDWKGNAEDLLNLLAPEAYAADFSEFNASDPAIKSVQALMNRVDHWLIDMRSIMPNGNIIEGEVNDIG